MVDWRAILRWRRPRQATASRVHRTDLDRSEGHELGTVRAIRVVADCASVDTRIEDVKTDDGKDFNSAFEAA